MMTTNSLKAHYRVEERTQAMTQFAETTPLNRMEMGEDTSIGIITLPPATSTSGKCLGTRPAC